MRNSLLFCLFVVTLSGCKRLPEAPAKLEDLCAFLFEHYTDEDTGYLEQGLINLDVWLENNFQETQEGYFVDKMRKRGAEELVGREVDCENLVGVSSAYDIRHPLDDVMNVVLKHDQADVYSTYESVERTYDPKPACFLAETCEEITYKQDSVSNYAMNLRADVTLEGQFRRVPFGDGTAIIRRIWMTRSEFNFGWLNLDESFNLIVTLDKGDYTRRLESIWVVTKMGEAPVPEALAMQLTLDTIQEGGVELETYLDQL